MAATPDDWKHLAFGEVRPIPYRADFSASEFEQLKQGLVPERMEDKWFIYFDDPFLCFHRSWTGDAVYRLKLQAAEDGCRALDAECGIDGLEEIDAAYDAELLDFLISNLLLGQAKPFPIPAGLNEKIPGVYQHAIAGTGYREKRAPAKPWWKVWR
jgi:hypothetical protein